MPAGRVAEGMVEIALRIPGCPTPRTPVEIRTRFLAFEAMVHAAKTLPPKLPDLLAMPVFAEGIDKLVEMMPEIATELGVASPGKT